MKFVTKKKARATMSAALMAARLVVPGFCAVKRLHHEAPRRINVWRRFFTTTSATATNTAATSAGTAGIQIGEIVLADSHNRSYNKKRANRVNNPAAE